MTQYNFKQYKNIFKTGQRQERKWESFCKGTDSVVMDTELTLAGVATSRPVTTVCPFAGVEHVRARVVLVLSVYQFGGVVASKPTVNTLSAAIDPPALLDHRHRAVLHFQDGLGFGFASHGKLR